MRNFLSSLIIGAKFLSSVIIFAKFFVECDYLCEIFLLSRIICAKFLSSLITSISAKYLWSLIILRLVCRFSLSLLASVVFKKVTQNAYLGCESVLRNTSIIPPQFIFTFVPRKHAASSSRRPVAWWC